MKLRNILRGNSSRIIAAVIWTILMISEFVQGNIESIEYYRYGHNYNVSQINYLLRVTMRKKLKHILE